MKMIAWTPKVKEVKVMALEESKECYFYKYDTCQLDIDFTLKSIFVKLAAKLRYLTYPSLRKNPK